MTKTWSRLIGLVLVSLVWVILAPGYAAAQDGAALYKKHCKKCHATDGVGNEKMLKILKMKDKDGKPLSAEKSKEKLNLLSQVSKDMSDADMQKLILTGREGTKMASFTEKLSPEPKKNAQAIVKHVRELQKAAK